ncbi:MAG: DUF6077 domain-containing protein, partial [Gemmatimonadota bacterium]|nr:DUF6077 domain-containing protein [Gemmatimonadota bacterium]
MARTLDSASDLAVLAYAAWTLIAYCGMATGAKATLLVFVWLATVPLGGAALFALSRRSESQSAPEPAAPPTAGAFARRSRRRLLAASLVAGLGSAFVAAVASSAPWIVVWAGTAVAVAVAVGMRGLRVQDSNDPAPAFAWPAHVFAAVAGLTFATMSLFIRKPNADDVFYVNRATGTAELNRIPVRDIIFTEERVPPVSGTGLPVDTFSALQGALARAVDVHAASVAYYVTPPLATFLATWALWRLLRLWAPRHAVLCFAVGCAYWVLSAQPGAGASRLAAGSFFLTRMWQGKVVFTAWLVLTLYVFLTRWVGKRDALTGVLLVAAGVASIGMTGSAAFVAPLVFAAGAVALVASRAWRGLPVLAGAAAFPFVVGLVATRKFPLT